MARLIEYRMICDTRHAFETMSPVCKLSLFINFVFLEMKHLEEEIPLNFSHFTIATSYSNMNQ